MKLSDAEIERLRQSGIRLDREGRFWHEGQEITHAGMRAAFYRWLDRAPPPDQRYLLRLDENRFVYLDVDELPFVVRSLRWQNDHAWIVLSDGSEEELAYSTVHTLPNGTPVATVKGRFDARFAPSAWAALGEHIQMDGERLLLAAAGGPYPLTGDS